MCPKTSLSIKAACNIRHTCSSPVLAHPESGGTYRERDIGYITAGATTVLMMSGQRMPTILGGALPIVLTLASSAQAQQYQHGQRWLLSLAAEDSTTRRGGNGGAVSKRNLRGGLDSSGFDAGLSDMVTTATKTTVTKMTEGMRELFLRDRSAETTGPSLGERGSERGLRVAGSKGAVVVAARGKAVGATVAEAEDETSREESKRKAARAEEIKQGSRGSNTRDDGGVEDDASSQSVAVIALCIGAVTIFLIGWCWLSSVVVCITCCVCKCTKRTSSSSASGNARVKYVDTYANAVQATLCGDLASVVCVPDGSVTATSEDGNDNERVTTSQPCTSHSTGNGTTDGSSSSSDSTCLNRGAVRSASAMHIEGNSGPSTSSATSSSSSSSSSAFSAIFRRSLTATAVTPVTPPPQYDSNKSGIDGTSFPSVTIGEEETRGDGDGSIFWQAEEKQSERSGRDSATVSRAPRPPTRNGIRLFGGAGERRSTARNVSGSERAGAISETLTRSWRSRFLARIGVTDRVGRSSNPVDLPGAAATRVADSATGQLCQTNTVTSSDGSSEQSPEGVFVDVGRCSGADDALVSHRRRAGPRVGSSQRRRVGPRMVGGGLSRSSSDGLSWDCVTPGVSPEASEITSSSSGMSSIPNANNNDENNSLNGRENDDVAAASGSNGAAASGNVMATVPTETSAQVSHDAGALQNAQPALSVDLSTSTTSGDVGSAASNPGALLCAENATVDYPNGRRTGGGGRGGGGRPANEVADRSEATEAISGNGRGSSAPWEGGGIAELCTSSSNTIGGGAAPAGAAAPPARSSHLTRPEEQQAENRNHSEGNEADHDAGKGGRMERAPVRVEGRITSNSGDARPPSPGLPIARVLWRAFSEVDHEKIGETHRLAAQRHQARFGPAPGVQNPPVCHVPIYNSL